MSKHRTWIKNLNESEEKRVSKEKGLKNHKKKKYQIVWLFPEWTFFFFKRQSSNSDWIYIYEWYLYVGWWEIRKWQQRDFEKCKLLRGNER